MREFIYSFIFYKKWEREKERRKREREREREREKKRNLFSLNWLLL